MKSSYVPLELREAAERIVREVEETETPIVITAHRNADPDAIGAVYALKQGLSRRVPSADLRIVLPEGMNQASKRVVRNILGIEPGDFEDEPPSESGLAIIVDTASAEQLGELREFIEQVDYILIDHHERNNLVEKAIVAVYDPRARASAELVYLLLRAWEVEVDPKTAAMLLAGIVYDTRHLRQSTSQTLRIAADLLDSGADLPKVLSALQSPPMEFSERVARLKAAQRLQVYRVGDDVLIGVTHVKAFEGSAARAILELGADAAFVVSVRDAKARVIGRCNRRFTEKTGLSLAEVLGEVGKALGGSGGGHKQAGGAEGRATLEKALGVLLDVLRRKLEEKGLKLEPLE